MVFPDLRPLLEVAATTVLLAIMLGVGLIGAVRANPRIKPVRMVCAFFGSSIGASCCLLSQSVLRGDDRYLVVGCCSAALLAMLAITLRSLNWL